MLSALNLPGCQRLLRASGMRQGNVLAHLFMRMNSTHDSCSPFPIAEPCARGASESPVWPRAPGPAPVPSSVQKMVYKEQLEEELQM